MKKQIHCIIHGRVQGVNFRWDGYSLARRLGLTGWIRNLPDGAVECVAEGEEEKLQQFIMWCEKGPSFAHVARCVVTWEKAGEDTFETFSISH